MKDRSNFLGAIQQENRKKVNKKSIKAKLMLNWYFWYCLSVCVGSDGVFATPLLLFVLISIDISRR